MRIWTRKSALIQPRTSLGKSDCVVNPGDVEGGRRVCRGDAEEARAAGWAHALSSSKAACAAAAASAASLFPRLVLGWISADFRVQIRIFQHFSSSTRKSSSRKQICKILLICLREHDFLVELEKC